VKHVAAFLRFWYDFIVGDDWRVAVGIAVALGATSLLADDGVSVWWLMPIAVVVVMALSLRRAIRAG
jgi:hypothetical protein